jgi:putative hydrolase of the HAD superfamily
VTAPGKPCVALDFGGTIAATGPSPHGEDVAATLRERFQVPVPAGLARAVDEAKALAAAAYRDHGQRTSWPGIVADAARKAGVRIPDPGEVAAALWDVVPDGAVDPGAAAAVRELRDRGHVLVLASNTRRPVVARRRTLAAAGTEDCFAALVLSSETGAAKPDPRFYAAVLGAASRHAGCAPDRVVFVGDTPEKDVAGPVRAGMRGVLIDPGPGIPPGLPDGARVVRHLRELPGLLEYWP